MKKILYRDDFYKKYKTNELMANEVNWGDSLIGRMLNSILRKAEIGYNLIRIDSLIEKLQSSFDLLKDMISVDDNEETALKLFYIVLSTHLGILMKAVIDGEDDNKSLIKISNETISNITHEPILASPPNKEAERDKELVIEKIEEFVKFLEVEAQEEGEGDEETEGHGEEESKKEVKRLDPVKIPMMLGVGKETSVGRKYISYAGEDLKLPIELTMVKKTDLELYKRAYLILTNKLIKYKEEVNSNDNELVEVDKIVYKKYRDKIWRFTHPDSNGGDKRFNEVLLKINEINIRYNKQKGKISKGELDFLVKTSEMIEETLIVKSISEELENIPLLGTGISPDIEEKITKIYLELLKQWKATQEASGQKNTKPGQGTRKKLMSEARIKAGVKETLSYNRFLEKKELEYSEIKEKWHLIFDAAFMQKFEVTEEDVNSVQEKDEKTITIDHIIEILKLFNRAYKIHTPGIIQSGRTGGKISNSVFREYEYIGEGSGGTPDSPGSGPYRNKVLFNKWENAVLDIIKNPEYQVIFNKETVFKFGKADERRNIKKINDDTIVQGGGRSLLSFMNELLDGGKLYRDGAQKKFIAEYFGVSVESKHLSMGSDFTKNMRTAKKQKDPIKLEFKKVENYLTHIKKDKPVGFIIRAVDAQNRIWYMKALRWYKNSNKVIVLQSSGFPFDINVPNTKRPKSENNMYLSTITVDSTIIFDKKRHIINEQQVKIEPVAEDFIIELLKYEILLTNGNIYTDTSEGYDKKTKNRITILKNAISRGLWRTLGVDD